MATFTGVRIKENSHGRKIFLIILLFNLIRCGASMQSQLLRKEDSLRNFTKVHIIIANPGGTISSSNAKIVTGFTLKDNTPSGGVSGMAGSSISAEHAKSGNDQVIMAAQDIAFGLRNMGFQTVNTPEESDLLANFSIGTIRYDPLAGWIADRAFLEFSNPKNGLMICSVKAEVQLVTPTVNKLVKSILEELKQCY